MRHVRGRQPGARIAGVRRIWSLLAFGAVLGGGVERVEAFESDEHRWITDAALCVLQKEQATTADRSISALWHVLNGLTAADPVTSDADTGLTLGDLSVYPDFVASPRRLVDQNRTGLGRINAEEIHLRSTSGTFTWEEMIRNPHHFGGSAVAEYSLWHEHALLLAEQARRAESDGHAATALDLLVDAVAYEGYALHFLQDLFAPGHIEAQDTRKSLTATLNRHDAGNMNGGTFYPNEQAQARLTQLPLTSFAACLGMGDASVSAFTEQRSSGQFHLEGDGRLYRHSVQRVYQPAQAILLAWVTSLSLADVILAYTKPVTNPMTFNFPPARFAKGRTGFGVAERGESAWSPVGRVIPLSFANAAGVGAAAAGGCAGETRDDSKPKTFAPADDCAAGGTGDRVCIDACPIGLPCLAKLPRTAIDVTVQRLNEDSRKSVSAQIFIDPWTLSPAESQTIEWSLGYTYVRGNSLDGHGPDSAVYYRWKNLYLWTSLGFGWRFLDNGHGMSNRPRGAARIGFGPEVISAFVGVAADASVSNGETKTDITSWEFGVQAIPPWQRIFAAMAKIVR